jgi:hypothetical protein
MVLPPGLRTLNISLYAFPPSKTSYLHGRELSIKIYGKVVNFK